MIVTVRQIAEAMVADPTPKIQGDLIKVRNGTVCSCAVGGAALQLGADPSRIMDKLGETDKDGVKIEYQGNTYADWLTQLGSLIWRNNDDTSITKAEIGQAILDTADEPTLNTAFYVKKINRKEWGLDD